MTRCAVKGCKSWNMRKGADKTIRFFSFPKDTNIKKLWIKSCKNHSSFNYTNAKVCSLHFAEDSYRLQDRLLNTVISKRMLSNDAIPTLFLPEPEQNVKVQERTNRVLKRSSKKIVEEALNQYDMDVVVIKGEQVCNQMDNQTECRKSIAVQTEEIDIDTSRDLALNELQKKLNASEKENQLLRQQNYKLMVALENSLAKNLTERPIKKEEDMY